MNAREFIDRVREESTLEYWGSYQGITSDDDTVVIKLTLPKGPVGLSPVYWSLPFSEIAQHTWDVLRSVLTGERSAENMLHMTRIVGYYSFVRDWNRSKKAELADRRKGNYTVPE